MHSWIISYSEPKLFKRKTKKKKELKNTADHHHCTKQGWNKHRYYVNKIVENIAQPPCSLNCCVGRKRDERERQSSE